MNAYGWLFAGVALMSWNGMAQAAPPDLSMCDGLAGVALGLCRGGVAAGCAGEGGGTMACLVIEGNYRDVSGGVEAPWLAPQYPVIRVALRTWAGIDLESGNVAYAEGMKTTDTSFDYCHSDDSCNALDIVPDESYYYGSAEGNPFLFLQRGCLSPDEPGYGVDPEFVILRDTAFEAVGSAAIDSAVFQQTVFGAPGPFRHGVLPQLGTNDTLIVHTCAGNYFKVGNQTCNFPGSDWAACGDPNLPEYWTGIDYQLLRSGP